MQTVCEDGPAVDIPQPLRCRPLAHQIGAQAIRLTRENKVAVLVWLGNSGRFVRGGIGVFDGDHLRMAYVGDWIVRPYTAKPYILPHEMFVRVYETT